MTTTRNSLFPLLTLFFLLAGSQPMASASQAAPPPVLAEASGWPTVAANPQRTSSVSEEISNATKVLWYRPIEAYVPQNSQVIAVNGVLYISTAGGLYALSADTGDVVWRYDTEMPLGNSPTIYNGVAYVGSMDKRLLAINAASGVKVWSYGEAKAGFATNPLVLSSGIYLGNRDGYFYAIRFDGTLMWKFKTDAPINYSAAASKDETRIYFASNDNYAYALDAGNGSLLWKSARLPTTGFDSYWPVVYTDRFTNKDFVVFSGTMIYRSGPRPSHLTMEADPYNYGAWSGWPQVQQGILSDRYGFAGPLPSKTSTPGWESGRTIVDGSPLVRWMEDYPDPGAQNGNRGKPWMRTVFILNAADGTEYTFDSNGDGKPEYAPFAFWGTHNGNRYPPIVGPDNVLYSGNVSNNTGIAGNAVMGWETGTPYFSLHDGILGATDEPQGLSFGGNILYRSICCDRWANWQNILSGASGGLWPYNGSTDTFPGYDEMWLVSEGYPRWNAWYTGLKSKGYAQNGIYHNHGDQNPLIPYGGKLFIHRSNAILALGPSTATAYGNKGALKIQPVSDPTIPALTTGDVVARLEAEVLKMVAAGDLRIGGYNNGQGGGSMEELVNYFESPGDTLATLSMAYPYVSAGVQAQLLPYLKQEFANYFYPTIYTSRGWTGKPREAFDIPPELLSDVQSKPKLTWRDYVDNTSSNYVDVYRQYSIYGLWKYAQVVPSDTLTAYSVAKSMVNVPSSVSDNNLTTFPWRLNNYISGYVGFLNLQKLAGKDVADASLRTQVTNELARLESLRVGSFSTMNNCYGFYGGNDVLCRCLNVARNFVYMTPELGEYLNRNALSKVQAVVDELSYVAPYWMQSGYNSAHMEKAKTNLYDTTMFLGRAYALKHSFAELAKYLDAPSFAVGDLIYIQNLIAALQAPVDGRVPVFADVPFSHPYNAEIEALYRAGYTAGCSADPLMYCPEATMNRAESSVFVERGIHTATYEPPTPASQVFADMPLDSWAARWVNGLWADHYTAGCGTNPLVYCPWQGHTRAEGCVFYLRMLNGATYEPPQPAQQTFVDVRLDAWYAKWVQAAYDAGLLTPCQTSPELRFCPEDPLTRALAAYMMVQAKGLQ